MFKEDNKRRGKAFVTQEEGRIFIFALVQFLGPKRESFCRSLLSHQQLFNPAQVSGAKPLQGCEVKSNLRLVLVLAQA